ncbi:MAG TPA: carboxypeptidase-like regulatory domain-containing protein [Candidatus Limnocylindria bacterium]|nr:carboxypeptidase-like regulatory domain-containing protein [Candidatus Limnocylindria bacterium]
MVAIGASGAPIPIAATQPPATPTPGLGPGTAYRIEGVVVDELGAPIPDVCIAIGPNGCQEHSPRTDARGVYFLDFPAAAVDYDLHFTKAGYKEFTQRLRPTQNQILNLVLGQ